MDLLDMKYPKRFKYCGDGSFLVEGRSPDAVDKKNKIVVLFQGAYWHCSPRKYKPEYYHGKIGKVAKEIWERDRKTIKFFRSCGYRVIIIWEDLLKKEV